MSNSNTHKPTRNAFYVAGTGRNARWIKIGAVFSHEDGKGETLLLDAIPLNFDGRITLRDREEPTTSEAAA